MNWVEIITGLLGMLSTGGVIYLLVDKKILSSKEKAEADAQSKSNQGVDIQNGLEALGFYKEIDALIKQHTSPLNEKIDELTGKVNKWCCYRNCEVRLRSESEAETEPGISLIEITAMLKKMAEEGIGNQ